MLLGYQLSWSGTEPSAAAPETFAPISLRGYGAVSGVWREETGGSVLEITCEDAEKAKLTQAKYLSDLQSLPGVKEVKSADTTGCQVEGQGIIAAWQQGSKVTILAAKSAPAFAALIAKVKPAGVTTPQVEVPMWLNRWDKFAFKHYYRPWQLPEGGSDQTYDFIAEFDYAQSQEQAGFTLYQEAHNSDTAEGMLNDNFGKWAIQEIAKRKLPNTFHVRGRAGLEPHWLLNRYRDQTQLKMPGFTGNFHSLMSPDLGGTGAMSWHSGDGRDVQLGLLQQWVRRYAAQPNTVSFREPHEETRHGDQDVFLEYGPLADGEYRRFLREEYGTPEQVAARWGVPIQSWDDVHVPELASFAGWGPEAIDAAPPGAPWRVGYEELAAPLPKEYNWYNQRNPLESRPAPEAWFQPGFDDAKWPEIPGAGHDRQMFLQKRPAVFRREFDVPAGWKAKNPRAWLYLWDLNLASGGEVRVMLNGKEIGRSKVGGTIHRVAFEASDAIKAGVNTLAVRVPQGYIAYKAYLSPVEPKNYPQLGEKLNAQWADFIDFTRWSRVSSIRRGIEMIRQVTPNHNITLPAPQANVDGLKELCKAYGAEFHDTGFMGAVWYDYLPSLMRGADLPFSIENGEPPVDLAEFKRNLGRWQTEGVQSTDYYIHIGSIIWKPGVKAEYEAQRTQLGLLGRLHFPKAEIATFASDRVAALTQFPWSTAGFATLSTSWNPIEALRQRFPYDTLTESSFAAGDAGPYRVIIDTNVSVMDEPLVAGIEKWVRAGGTFVAVGQTGRHTSLTPDAWPIARLTGAKVTGEVADGRLRPAPGQTIFDSAWNGARASGLRLAKVAPDAHDLLLWEDGSVAAAVRPLGKGFVVQLGGVVSGGASPKAGKFRDALDALLKWRNIKPEPCRLAKANDSVTLRHAVSNNGLYDAWTLWNESGSEPQTVSVVIETGQTPAFAINVFDGSQTALRKPEISNIALGPFDTRVFLTPRGRITEAPAAWFDLQRKWWRGTTKPSPKQLPPPPHRWARELTTDWKFQTLDKAADATPLLAADFDDSAWSTRDLGIWNVKSEGGGKGHGVFRKKFTVPADWTNGPVSLWLTSWANQSFTGKGRVWLDGREVKPLDTNGYVGNPVPALTPGSTHTLAVEVRSDGVLAGLRGESWISYEPAPPVRQDLAGDWAVSADGLTYDKTLTLPGKFTTPYLKRKIFIDEKQRGKNVVLTIDGDRRLICAIVNGRLVRRHHHTIAERGSLNITPFVRFGEENDIELVRWDFPGGTVQWDAPTKDLVRELFLGFYEPGAFP